MAVQPQTPYKEYTANGSTKSFALEFDCENQDYLVVLVDDAAPSVGSWSLSNNAVVFNTAPTNGKKITIQRNTPASRSTNFQSSNNSFRPDTLNKDLDRIWLKLQELGVADMLLKIYVDRLHMEQKSYIDDQDQIIENIISDLRNYVNQQDVALSNDIGNLRTYVNQQDNALAQSISNLRNYTDQQDSNQKTYLENLINQQGVSLQQLDNYYNYLMQRIAAIAVEKGWDASFVVDASGKTQQEINKLSKTVFSIAELKTISAGNGDVVRTSCHTVSGLGAGTYIFEALSSKTDNGGSYIASTKSAGIWVLISDNLYFEHFGVVPGQADQSVKMNSAIDYALSIGIKKISFEKSNTYYYNNYVLIKPRLISPAYVVTTTDFEIDLNDAVLKPISKGLKLFIIGRDLVSFRNFNATAQDIKNEADKADKDSVAFCLGLPSDLAAAYPKETYRWSAQHCEFYNPKCAYFGEMFLFNPAWAVFYSYFENPIAASTYYMFAFDGNQTSTFMQVTRSTIISPKHIGGTCTFWLNCAETTKVFGGAAEFINYEDVYGRISTPTSIYEPQISEGIVVTSATQSHNVFTDFDIEHARSFVNMSGLHSDWRGRVFKLVDASDNEVTTQAGWLNAVTGKCFTNWRGWKKGEYGSLNVETFAGVSPSLNMISYKTKEDLSTTLMSHALTASLSKNSLNFSLVGADLSASFYIDFGAQVKNVKASQFESATLKTNDIRASTGDSLRTRGATTNGAELNIAYNTDGSTVKLQAWNLGVGARANLILDMAAVFPYINNTVDLGSQSLRFNRIFTKTLNYSDLVFDSSGAGSPEGVVSAGVGSTYRRLDGGAGTTFYVKESGVGSTGWVAK